MALVCEKKRAIRSRRTQGFANSGQEELEMEEVDI